MFNVPSFDCICTAWKMWLTKLVPGAAGEPRERRDRHRRSREQRGSSSSKRANLDLENPDSKRNRHSWHATSTSSSESSGLGFDQRSLEGYPGEPHSGNHGVPHGEYRKSWHLASPSRNNSSGSVTHQSSCPSSFYRQDKPKREFKLPLRTESCPNSSHNHSMVLEPSPSPSSSGTRPNNLSFHTPSLEYGADKCSPSECTKSAKTSKSRQRRTELLAKSRKQEAFDEGDATSDIDDTVTESGDASGVNGPSPPEENIIIPVRKGGRTLRCKDCGGRITVSVTTPTPTSANPKIYRLKR